MHSYSFAAYSIGKIGVKTAQNSIHFAVNRKKCSNTNGYSDFGFQTKILFCLICYVKAAIAPHVYPVVYSLAMALAFPCLCCVPCACAMCAMCALSMPLDDDVSPPLAAGMVVWCASPPGGTGVGRGGGMVLRTRGTPIYILIYILRFISLF